MKNINDLIDLDEWCEGEPIEVARADFQRSDLRELNEQVEIQTELSQGCGLTIWRTGGSIVATLEFRCDEWTPLATTEHKEAAKKLRAAVKRLCSEDARYRSTRQRWYCGDVAIRYTVAGTDGAEIFRIAAEAAVLVLGKITSDPA